MRWPGSHFITSLGVWIGCVLLTAGFADLAIGGQTIEEQVQVRGEVHEFLVRLGAIHEGPYKKRGIQQRMDEMWRSVGPWSDLVLESLGHFLRNPEAEFDECTITAAVDPFAAKLPDKAVKMLLKAMPTRTPSGDRCVLDALVRIGPAAYPSLVKQGKTRSSSKAGLCLSALVEQSAEVPGSNRALGLGDETGMPELPED